MIGQTLAHYRVVEKIGAGGMGEVYRATDTRLGRDVALKVLPDAFARDPNRLARFQREAQVLASLNHPHIAAIHGLEEADGVRFLVLELVPGPTLAEQVARGPLPLEEAIHVCRQIAEALEAAHEKGIIHRDLKPGNVKVTPEGQVKVLDFGLAKAFAGEAAATDLSKSPTISEAATRTGVLLGTAAYMSPEQARGKPLDKRTDIWSFGCVLFELLSGQRAFRGETVTDTIAAIVKEEPDWQALPKTTPTKIQDLLHRCLQKDPARRLHDIADARLEIEEPLSRASAVGMAAPLAVAMPRPLWRRALPWAAAGLLALLAGVGWWVAWRAASPPPRPVSRFLIALPAAQRLPSAGAFVALSPDGRRLVYVGLVGGSTRLFMRPVDALEAIPLAGTEGATSPFFSPDGQWVGFFALGKLRKVPVTGGAVMTLCDAPSAYGLGASWGPDGTIVFAPVTNSGLVRVSAAGGKPEVVTTLNPKQNETSHRWPDVLPGGKAVIFSVDSAASSAWDDARIVVQSLETGEQKTVVQGGTAPHYAPTGHLIYARDGALLAVPFDLERLEVMGPPVAAVDGVAMDSAVGAAQFTLSTDGSLVYVPRGVSGSARTLFWTDRKGAARPITETERAYAQLRLSPDGRQVALTLREANSDVWVYDLARGTLTRLSFEPEEDEMPIWTPDGKRVTFSSQRGLQRKVFWKPADGSGTEETLLAGENHTHAISWSPDARVLTYEELNPATGWDLWVLEFEPGQPKSGAPPAPAGPPAVAGKARPFLRTPFAERFPEFSPDGRWIAYFSNESGRDEVYVQPFPGPGGKWQISTEGGAWPLWARNGRELFYRNGEKIMSVALTTEPTFTPATPRVLLEGWYEYVGGLAANYDIALDGQRLLLNQRSEKQTAPTQLHVVLNWFEELKRLAPAR